VSVVRQFLRPRWLFGHLLVVLALLVCLRLGWWQVDRSEESDGTLQNIGYAVLWPLFGLAFVYMWVTFMRLEVQRATTDEADHEQSLSLVLAEADAITAEAAGPQGTTARPAAESSPADLPTIDAHAPLVDDDSDDPELAAYNRALAALAEEDRSAG